jgi:hypothetical protein
VRSRGGGTSAIDFNRPNEDEEDSIALFATTLATLEALVAASWAAAAATTETMEAIIAAQRKN